MKAAITAKNISVRHAATRALADSSFEVPFSAVTAVIGPNGSGKSTLLNAIAGLHPLSSGSIEFGGGGRPDISLVLQTTKLNSALPVTVREVVSMGRYATAGSFQRLTSEDKAVVDTAMERLDIVDIATRRLDELSGGQRQRVFVAQGIAQDHAILLLDEPLTGIDFTAARAIDDLIHDETGRGCTVVMTTHDLSEAQQADYVLLLSGRVVASGTPDEILTMDNLVDAYGDSLLHVGEGGTLFVDDPAHAHGDGHHTHRDRTIHMETSPTELHGPDEH